MLYGCLFSDKRVSFHIRLCFVPTIFHGEGMLVVGGGGRGREDNILRHYPAEVVCPNYNSEAYIPHGCIYTFFRQTISLMMRSKNWILFFYDSFNVLVKSRYGSVILGHFEIKVRVLRLL